MIVNKDINPERDVYYLGSKVIELLSSTDEKYVDFFSTFDALKSSIGISMNLFALSLDWLYTIGVIDKPDRGQIVKCF